MRFDMFIPQVRTFIEINGYVHSKMSRHKKTDDQKREWCEHNGYNLIILSCERAADQNNAITVLENQPHYKKYGLHKEQRQKPEQK